MTKKKTQCSQTIIWLIAGAAGLGSAQAQTLSVTQLSKLSIEELGRIEVTSVSKRAEPVGQAPSAVYVITHEDIVRSGATRVPEILRLAPNLHVAQASASRYVITARGLNGNSQAQSYSNKLLVLIDGRTVYNPLFSGVYWDMQDVLPEDIERVEVVSGPGAALWGANAVNGVINIITRSSTQTQGGFLEVTGGNDERNSGVRYGGRVNDALTARAYALGFDDRDTVAANGARANDNAWKYQGGFRLDWEQSGDAVTVQGDAYHGAEAQPAANDEEIGGANLLARWVRSDPAGSEWRVQTYYDQTERGSDDGGHFNLENYDFDLQHSLTKARHEVVWGGGVRISRYHIAGTPSFLFAPAERTLHLYNAFVQDSLALRDDLKLTLGLKIEDNDYSHATPLPSLRLAWTPRENLLLWTAASRAVRSATPFDRDVIERLGATTFLVGNGDFSAEKLTAYELGVRIQPASRLSMSVSTFYHRYDSLRSIETAPSGFIPLRWGNLMEGYTYGLETWGDFAVTSWWRLSAAFSTLTEHLRFKPGSSQLLGVKQAGNDPARQASLRSSMDLTRQISFEAALRYVGPLPEPHAPSYADLNARIAWNVSDRLQLSLSGFNLLHPYHVEFAAADANAAPRSFLANLRWRFF